MQHFAYSTVEARQQPYSRRTITYLLSNTRTQKFRTLYPNATAPPVQSRPRPVFPPASYSGTAPRAAGAPPRKATREPQRRAPSALLVKGGAGAAQAPKVVRRGV